MIFYYLINFINKIVMKKKNFYASDNLNDSMLYPKSYFISKMKEEKLKEIIVWTVKKDFKSNYFFCSATKEFCLKTDKYENCEGCKLFEALGKKKGYCKHFEFCYIPDKMIVLKNDKIAL